MEGMRAAVRHVMGLEGIYPLIDEASSKIEGSYIVGNCGKSGSSAVGGGTNKSKKRKVEKVDSEKFYALVDGNRYPNIRSTSSEPVKLGPDMPCEGEPMIKGDGREYCIAAASILAKVTRDRLMREYDMLYPEFLLAQHKGYPTREHMMKVFLHGEIRLSFLCTAILF